MADTAPVIEQSIEIRTDDGVVDGFLYHAGTGQRPGVLFLTDIVGIRPASCDIARRLVGDGYTVLLPNVFYRTGKPPVFPFEVNHAEERTQKRFAELAAPLTPEAMEQDAEAYIEFLTTSEFAMPGPVGVVGYCFTGAMAMRAAARCENVAALASFHGGRLFTETPASPHLLLPRIRARLYFAHAEGDRTMPAEAIEKLNQALKDWHGQYESETYSSARHGWTMADSPAYNPTQAERAYGKLTSLFEETLRERDA